MSATETALRFVPDRWLVVGSDELWRAIAERWAGGDAPESLTRLRLRSQVDHIDHKQLAERLSALKGERCRTIRIVLERFDSELPALLSKRGLASMDLRAHFWRETPLEVMQTLAAPEDAYLDAWAKARSQPLQLVLDGPQLELGWREEFLDGVALWEIEMRHAHGEEFAATYDPELDEQPGTEPETWPPHGEMIAAAAAYDLERHSNLDQQPKLAEILLFPSRVELARAGARRGAKGIVQAEPHTIGPNLPPWPGRVLIVQGVLEPGSVDYKLTIKLGHSVERESILLMVIPAEIGRSVTAIEVGVGDPKLGPALMSANVARKANEPENPAMLGIIGSALTTQSMLELLDANPERKLWVRLRCS